MFKLCLVVLIVAVSVQSLAASSCFRGRSPPRQNNNSNESAQILAALRQILANQQNAGAATNAANSRETLAMLQQILAAQNAAAPTATAAPSAPQATEAAQQAEILALVQQIRAAQANPIA